MDMLRRLQKFTADQVFQQCMVSSAQIWGLKTIIFSPEICSRIGIEKDPNFFAKPSSFLLRFGNDSQLNDIE